MKDYDPKNWYWIVGGSTTQVYSSAVGDFVLVGNPTYQAWLAEDGVPTRIGSEVELGEVLSIYSLRPVHAAVLDGYKDAQTGRLTVEIVAKILLWCVNEIRVLKGQSPVNAAQFKAFIKDQL